MNETATKPLIMSADDRLVIDQIIAPAAPQEKHGIIINEGYRYVAFGESGCGKTSLMRAVVYATLAKRYARFALIHDTKGIFPEYPHSVQVANVKSWASRGGFKQGDLPLVSFRGNPRTDEECSAEEVARLSLTTGQRGIERNGVWHPNPHVTVIEEMSEASTKSGKNLKGVYVSKLATQGRKIGISLVATTQRPKKAAEDIITQATSVTFGRLTGGDANYLVDVMDLDGRMVDAIRGPNGEGLPNYDFVLWIKGQPWDGEIHRLDKHTAMMYE